MKRVKPLTTVQERQLGALLERKAAQDVAQTLDILELVWDRHGLTTAMWWFIENVSEDTAGRSEAYQFLREKYRAQQKT